MQLQRKGVALESGGWYQLYFRLIKLGQLSHWQLQVVILVFLNICCVCTDYPLSLLIEWFFHLTQERSYKVCLQNGSWYTNQLVALEWTDYTDCFTVQVLILYTRCCTVRYCFTIVWNLVSFHFFWEIPTELKWLTEGPKVVLFCLNVHIVDAVDQQKVYYGWIYM